MIPTTIPITRTMAREISCFTNKKSNTTVWLFEAPKAKHIDPKRTKTIT